MIGSFGVEYDHKNYKAVSVTGGSFACVSLQQEPNDLGSLSGPLML